MAMKRSHSFSVLVFLLFAILTFGFLPNSMAQDSDQTSVEESISDLEDKEVTIDTMREERIYRGEQGFYSHYPEPSLHRTSGGNYVIQNSDSLTKINRAGNEIWHTILPDVGNPHWVGTIPINEGYLIVTSASRSSQPTLTLVSHRGDIEWNRTFIIPGDRGVGLFYGSLSWGDAIQIADGSVIIAGSSNAGDNGGTFVMNIDLEGNVNWQTAQNNTIPSDPVFTQFCYYFNIIPTNDGGFLLSGRRGSIVSAEICVEKWNSDGTVDWINVYDISGIYGPVSISWSITPSRMVDPIKVIESSEGSYVLATSIVDLDLEKVSFYLQGEWDILLLKLEDDGNLLWTKRLDTGEGEVLQSIVESNDGGLILAANMVIWYEEEPIVRHFIWIVKLDEYGIVEWHYLHPDPIATMLDDIGYRNTKMDLVLTPQLIGDPQITIVIKSYYNDLGVGTISFFTFEKDPSIINDTVIIVAILVVVLVSSAIIFFRSRTRFRDLSQLGKSYSIIKEIFQSQTTLYFVLTGQDTLDDKKLKNSIKEQVPKRLYDYKYLFHPIKLSLTKVLFENLSLTSIELKNILEISWNDYTHNIKALEKKGIVEISDTFVDGTRRQNVSLTSDGMKQYRELTDLLQIFLDNAPEYEDYLDDNLYPSK